MNYKLLILFLFFSTSLFAQKYDYQWLFGYKTNPDLVHPDYGRSVLDFNTDPPDIYYENQNINMDATNVSICDTLGNLLFYTNGIVIVNSQHEEMENGFGLTPGAIANSFSEWGYPNVQGALVLPLPNSDSIYYLFHQRTEYPTPSFSSHASTLFLTKIDMNQNNGLGKVMSKNEILVHDTLDIGKVTAVHHANGRDWWIINGEFDSNQFYTFLLTPDGIEDYGKQEVGVVVPSGLGQSVFSPDGSKYAKLDLAAFDIGNFLNIYDFDRCTGELSNHIQIAFQDSIYSAGVAISPNSRYLYQSSFTYVVQYDLEAADIAASADTVAFYDGYTDSTGLASTFFMAQLAPNGKIYINANNGVKELHVINSPDSAGLACDLQQHSLKLPTFNKVSLPNFPNYRLGALDDSPCDTLDTSVENLFLEKDKINIYPNPATDWIKIDWENIKKESSLILTNSLGQVVLSKELSLDKTQMIYLEGLNMRSLFLSVYSSKSNCKKWKINYSWTINYSSFLYSFPLHSLPKSMIINGYLDIKQSLIQFILALDVVFWILILIPLIFIMKIEILI